MGDQQRDIFPSLPQGRHANFDDVDTEKQVLPEPSLSELLVDVSIRGGHEADVKRDRLEPSKPPDGVLLQRAEQLGLKRGA